MNEGIDSVSRISTTKNSAPSNPVIVPTVDKRPALNEPPNTKESGVCEAGHGRPTIHKLKQCLGVITRLTYSTILCFD